ncbi:MAG: hypothetical protein ACYTBP_01755 [Planctomycetota bacterium]|jgi:hypothetical protein
MIKIAEKVGFMKTRAVKVCAKVGIRRKVGHKKCVFPPFFNKTASKTKILDSSR